MDSQDWKIISVDDHVLEPPHTWTSRLPARFVEQGPRLATDDEGREVWVFEGVPYPTSGLSAVAGKAKEQFSADPVTYSEMRPGCYDPVARIGDMDRDGILASLCFPSFPRFCGQKFYEADDKELGLLCVQAYNDFMTDEWAGAAPGRFIPLVIIPLWDPAAAVAEIERTAAKGAKAITFSENPSKLGLPSIHDRDRYWDPVFAAAEETSMPLCMHIGSSSDIPVTSPDAPPLVMIVNTPLNACYALSDWLLSGVLIRFPRLKLCLSEGGIGWIPYMLERMDYSWDKQKAWAGAHLPQPPSHYFADHVYGCFIDDEHGVESLHRIGVDNVMIESDYPHTDSTWPHTVDMARKRLGHLDDVTVQKILRGNAERVFAFQPSDIGQR